jgi:hypothetical protein
VKLGVEPIEGAANVVDLAVAVVVFALTEPSTAKVEAEDGKSKMVQRFHGVEYDLVVQRAAEKGMGMADERGVGGVRGARVEQGFEASGGTGEKKRADGRSLRHSSGYTKCRASFGSSNSPPCRKTRDKGGATARGSVCYSLLHGCDWADAAVGGH